MARYKLIVEYDGQHFAGWQIQNDVPTVQEHLQNAIFKFCGENVKVVAAGRTDAGVHALGQTVHCDLEKDHDPFRVLSAINFHLIPAPIAVLSATLVSEEFHARFSATSRHYTYRIINRRPRLTLDIGRAWHITEPLDAAAMHEAAQSLVGHHDFTTFRDTMCQAKSPEKTLDRLDVTRQGDEIRIYGGARSFLHHQMRNMVGSLRLVGNGKWSKADLETARDAKDRRAGGETSPPDGLYLTGVGYD